MRSREAYSRIHMSEQDPRLKTRRAYGGKSAFWLPTNRSGEDVFSPLFCDMNVMEARKDVAIGKDTFNFLTSYSDLFRSGVRASEIAHWVDQEIGTEQELLLEVIDEHNFTFTWQHVTYSAEGAMIEQLYIDHETSHGTRGKTLDTDGALDIEPMNFDETFVLCQQIRSVIHDRPFILELQSRQRRQKELTVGINRSMRMTENAEMFDVEKKNLRTERDTLPFADTELWQLNPYL